MSWSCRSEGTDPAWIGGTVPAKYVPESCRGVPLE